MMKRLIFLFSAFLMFACASVASAQSPCDTAMPPGVTINPAKIYIRIPEFNTVELDGQPRVTSLLFGLWPEGGNTATTPVQGPSSIPRASIVQVSGDPGCYVVDTVPSLPSATKLQAAVQPQRAARGSGDTAIAAGVGPWSALSGSFGAVPSALAATGRPNLRQ